jgi:hypothetical protein
VRHRIAAPRGPPLRLPVNQRVKLKYPVEPGDALAVAVQEKIDEAHFLFGRFRGRDVIPGIVVFHLLVARADKHDDMFVGRVPLAAGPDRTAPQWLLYVMHGERLAETERVHAEGLGGGQIIFGQKPAFPGGRRVDPAIAQLLADRRGVEAFPLIQHFEAREPAEGREDLVFGLHSLDGRSDKGVHGSFRLWPRRDPPASDAGENAKPARRRRKEVDFGPPHSTNAAGCVCRYRRYLYAVVTWRADRCKRIRFLRTQRSSPATNVSGEQVVCVVLPRFQAGMRGLVSKVQVQNGLTHVADGSLEACEQEDALKCVAMRYPSRESSQTSAVQEISCRSDFALRLRARPIAGEVVTPELENGANGTSG